MTTLLGLVILGAIIVAVGIAIGKSAKPGRENAGFPASRKTKTWR